ncbi:MAG: Rieske 2Fe-2S domain-containing protein [Myxococcota bacterium]
MTSDLTSVAVYRRTVHASIERVWENVHDWEHLPWLHAGSFSSIALVERGDWGWKARIGLGAGEILLELVRERDAERYVSRTLEGPGARTEIWTTLTPVAKDRTDIEVEFLVPGVAPDAASKVGAGFTALYTRLWDEDEAMMQQRTAELARRDAPGDAPATVDLGPEAEVRGRLPLVAEIGGRRVRVIELDGEWIAHGAVCPHWLGPLDAAPVEDGRITCPWHGYRFDVRSGRRCDAASPMRLPPAPRVVVAEGRVLLEAR